jgi:hypothetical protein
MRYQRLVIYGDSDAASTFCHLLESSLNSDHEAIQPIAKFIRNAIQQILHDFERFECDPKIYGDVQAKYRALLARLNF